jgi:hypothetical protein
MSTMIGAIVLTILNCPQTGKVPGAETNFTHPALIRWKDLTCSCSNQIVDLQENSVENPFTIS